MISWQLVGECRSARPRTGLRRWGGGEDGDGLGLSLGGQAQAASNGAGGRLPERPEAALQPRARLGAATQQQKAVLIDGDQLKVGQPDLEDVSRYPVGNARADRGSVGLIVARRVAELSAELVEVDGDGTSALASSLGDVLLDDRHQAGAPPFGVWGGWLFGSLVPFPRARWVAGFLAGFVAGFPEKQSCPERGLASVGVPSATGATVYDNLAGGQQSRARTAVGAVRKPSRDLPAATQPGARGRRRVARKRLVLAIGEAGQ